MWLTSNKRMLRRANHQGQSVGGVTVKAANIVSTITIRVKGLNLAVARCRLASVFFKAGALVAGCAIDIAVDDQRK